MANGTTFGINPDFQTKLLALAGTLGAGSTAVSASVVTTAPTLETLDAK